MVFYEWNKSLEIHVRDMNDEHKVLIGLMNQLHHEVESGQPKDVLQKTFQDLVRYTRQHFHDEEQYMYSINYPGLPTHRLIHERLLKELDQFYGDFCEGDGTLGSVFFEFLKVWLNAHIRGIDVQYSDHSMSVRRTA
jgi:hemerythrin